MWHVIVVFYNLQEVEHLERLVRAAKQDEKKKELQSQLDIANARRDLADAKAVMLNSSTYMYMYNYRRIIDIDTC